jgi:hypothetical protein
MKLVKALIAIAALLMVGCGEEKNDEDSAEPPTGLQAIDLGDPKNLGEILSGGYDGIKYLDEARTFDDLMKATQKTSQEFGRNMNKRLKFMGLKEFTTPYPTLGPEGQVGRTKKMATAMAKWDADFKAHFNSEVVDHKMRRIQTLFKEFPKLRGRVPKNSKLLSFLGRTAKALQVLSMIEDLNGLMNGAPEEEKQALAETAKYLQKIEAIQEESRKDEVAIAKAKKAAGQRILNNALMKEK